MSSPTIRSAALLLALTAAACDSPPRAAAADGADALTGEWSGELVVTQPMLGRADSAHAGTARGTISLLRDDQPRRVRGLSGAPTHVGAQTIRLRPFGFEPRAGGGVPGVAARWIAPDSVELAFESGAPGEAFTIRGRLRGDSVAGRWHWSARATGGAAGHVVLRRMRKP